MKNWLLENWENKKPRPKLKKENIVEFIIAAWKQILEETIRKSFQCCGIGCTNAEQFHTKLKEFVKENKAIIEENNTLVIDKTK